jgi:DMSO/TMAO reductase YedYZ molybdopterin-dependent catalytic subunit
MRTHDDLPSPEALGAQLERRRLLRTAAWGTAVATLGAWWVLSEDLTREARAQAREDGRPRLPPGQRVLKRLKPMGGQPGDPSPRSWQLKVYGEVERPFTLGFSELLALPQVELPLDVHCVTGWSVLGAKFKGVRLTQLAEKAKLKSSARFVIFEAAHGYTANVSLRDALKPNVMVAHQLEGAPLASPHGAPVRNIVPELYFWKSAKWLTAIHFVERDRPGYWETRGYHNRADPWLEERYS